MGFKCKKCGEKTGEGTELYSIGWATFVVIHAYRHNLDFQKIVDDLVAHT